MRGHVLYVFFCQTCQATMEIETVTDEWIDGKPVSGHYACSGCGESCGIWANGGMIDLAELRGAPSDLDFWVYDGPLLG